MKPATRPEATETRTDAAGVAVFDPRGVYSREALRRMLEGIVDVDRFCDRLQVPKRFKNAFLGSDIIRALENPPEVSRLRPDVDVRDLSAAAGDDRKRLPAKRRRKTAAADPFRPIDISELSTTPPRTEPLDPER